MMPQAAQFKAQAMLQQALNKSLLKVTRILNRSTLSSLSLKDPEGSCFR